MSAEDLKKCKENKGYFDSDENELNDSDLGDSDSLLANAEESYYAVNGASSSAHTSNDQNDIDPANCELTIDSFSELTSCDDIGCTTSSNCISDKLYSDGLTT